MSFFFLYLNIRGLRQGPGKFFMGSSKSRGFFFVGKRVGTLREFAYKDQSNLANGRIAESSSAFSSPRWQHRVDGLAAICNCVFWLAVGWFL